MAMKEYSKEAQTLENIHIHFLQKETQICLL